MNIGIVLPHLGSSQLSFFFIQSANNLLSKTKEHDVVFFYERFSVPCTKMLCGSMHSNELWCFDGLLITTTISNTLAATKAVNRAKKVFYVNDLEWTRDKTDFLYNIRAFRDVDHVISRCPDHTEAIENYSGIIAKLEMPLPNIEEIVNYAK